MVFCGNCKLSRNSCVVILKGEQIAIKSFESIINGFDFGVHEREFQDKKKSMHEND